MRRAGTVLAVLALGGCGSSAPVSTPEAPESLRQVANGPVAPAPGPRPLAVDLAHTSDPVVVDFPNPPKSGLLFDLDTGKVLWRRLPERVLPLASLTKMMTALLVVDDVSPRERVHIPKGRFFEGSAGGVLPGGKDVRAETLLYGLMLPSGNDAARALALHVAGSLRAFVALMNQRAAEMGLRCTHFT